MQIILLSGGAGARLWPLSNEARSKQFLKILRNATTGQSESMIQRVFNQIKNSGLAEDNNITVATSSIQIDSVQSQLGHDVNLVVEPSRRDTFPAICLACEYLSKSKGISPDEIIIVMPCDPVTEDGYFLIIRDMAEAIRREEAKMAVMGIKPTQPSSKFGYILPNEGCLDGFGGQKVEKFVEKPDKMKAKELLERGAYWNGGVFAFRLGFILHLASSYVESDDYEGYVKNFNLFPITSFDYEVAEKCDSIIVFPFNGKWKDLGTWNSLTEELDERYNGNVIADNTNFNTHIINELNIPILCLGTSDLVIAATPDGIIVTDKSTSERVKEFSHSLKQRPMYEERRWGNYRVLDSVNFADGYSVLTKQLVLMPGSFISYQRHRQRDEVWTIVDGTGEIVIDGKLTHVKRGDVFVIDRMRMHALRATTQLTLIEVQKGENLVESDIERFEYNWC